MLSAFSVHSEDTDLGGSVAWRNALSSQALVLKFNFRKQHYSVILWENDAGHHYQSCVLSPRPFDSPRSVPRLDVRPPGDERSRSAHLIFTFPLSVLERSSYSFFEAVLSPAGNIARLDGSPRMPQRVSLCPVKRGILWRLEILE